MANIDCVVDTEPMAQEITTVSRQIKGTTAAVIGMRAAVIQAEEAAADHVCDNVNKGFYTLIHSQISQKIARLQSEVDSHLMKLRQLQRQLTNIRSRMERDYNMISTRYLKLFNGLNKNLQQRVFELDKPTIEFAVKDVDKVSNRTKQLTATVPVAQLESLAASQRILASNIKYRGLKVIDSMTKFLSDMEEQKQLTDRILLSSDAAAENASLMIPVIISESNYDELDNRRTDIAINESGLSAQTRQAIGNTIGYGRTEMEWQDAPEIADEIKSEFGKYLSASTAPDRVKETTRRLFAANRFQTIKNQQS